MPSEIAVADEPGLWKLVMPFVLWVTIGAVLVFGAVFAVLCWRECTALPWFTLVIAPLVCMPVAAILAVKAYRRAQREAPSQRTAVLVVALTSFFWAPMILSTVMGIVGTAAAVLGAR